ncbi:MAG: RebB family R body protein [Kordia sp.]|uniref:RebB family R body protein n=1 Tax=Kordia sp. TaxID=1965332 RepID=UPI00385966F1
MTKKTEAQPKNFPTSVNSQITDSVTEVNTKVLGDEPAIATGNLMEATAQALSNAAHNATTGQEETEITSQAATTEGISTLYDLDTASTGVATEEILGDKK